MVDRISFTRSALPTPKIQHLRVTYLFFSVGIDTLCVFYDNRDEKPEEFLKRIASQVDHSKRRDWAWNLLQSVTAIDRNMGNYEPIYRVWLAKLVGALAQQFIFTE